MSNGTLIYFRVCFSSRPQRLAKRSTQQSYTFEEGPLEAKGRHDPSRCTEGGAIVEAMGGVGPSDALMAQNAREECEEPYCRPTEGDIANRGEWATRPKRGRRGHREN